MTLVSCNEHADLRQVNVRVEIVNKPKRNRDVCTVTERDERDDAPTSRSWNAIW